MNRDEMEEELMEVKAKVCGVEEGSIEVIKSMKEDIRKMKEKFEKEIAELRKKRPASMSTDVNDNSERKIRKTAVEEYDDELVIAKLEECAEGEDSLISIARDNGKSFFDKVNNYSTCVEFLHRETNGYIPIRSTETSISEYETLFDVKHDIDGIVIEWKKLAINHMVRHLRIMPRDKESLKKMYPMLKKHLPLIGCNDKYLVNVKKSKGCQIFYDSNWEYWLGLVPSEKRGNIQYKDQVFLESTFLTVSQIRSRFQLTLQKERETGRFRDTLAKNNLINGRTFFILPKDSASIIDIFQDCLDKTIPPTGFKLILFSFRFGEKDPQNLVIPTNDLAQIESVSIHVGTQFIPKCTMDVMWSRQGIQNVIGQRGCLTTALSFFECCNFQSNLDGRLIDISPELRKVCTLPNSIRFVQLYTDTPHRYPDTKIHPVSGALITTKGVHDKIRQSFSTHAEKYISEMENNILQIQSMMCRLEFVVAPDQLNSNIISPTEFVDSRQLLDLFSKQAMIVPFLNPDYRVTGLIRTLGCHIVTDLKKLLQEFKSTGNCSAVWKAYQHELCLEKLIWGRPLSYLSNIYAVNLGSGTGYPSRCKTDRQGFLAVEDSTVCLVDDHTSPPLNIWTYTDKTRNITKYLFGFHDFLQSADHVVGGKLINILLQELYDQMSPKIMTFTGLFLDLKSDGKPYNPVDGTISLIQLSEILTKPLQAKGLSCFVTASKMLTNEGKDLKSVIIEGVKEVNIKYFPAVRLWDTSGNRSLSWKRPFKYWTLISNAQQTGLNISTVTELVLTELEKRKLAYITKLKGIDFPWMTDCMRKLKPKKTLNEQETIRCLTFLTCIGLQQNGRYIDFYKFSQLRRELPVDQYELKGLEILSKILLKEMHVDKIYRLHPSIPIKMMIKNTDKNSNPAENNKKEQDEELQERKDNELEERNWIDDESNERRIGDEDNNQQDVVHVESRHRSGNYKKKWTPEEMQILDEMLPQARTNTLKELYEVYKKKSLENNIPDRTFESFRLKMQRIQKK